MADDEKLLKTACDWVNANWAELHTAEVYGVNKINLDDIVSHRKSSNYLIMIADRGPLGSPKYTIPLAKLEKQRLLGRVPTTSEEPHYSISFDSDFDYSSLTVAQIKNLSLARWSKDELLALFDHEQASKKRASVIELIEEILTAEVT